MKFSPNDGRDIETREYQYGQWYGSLPNMSRTGYDFDGWYTAETVGTKLDVHSVVTGGTYYAHWNIKTYNVTFDANGGACSTSSKSITYGSSVGTLPTPSREKHEFRGWYTEKLGGRKIDASEKIVGDVTYYAQWNVLEGQWTDAAGFRWDFSIKNGAATLTGCKQLSGAGSFVTPFGPTVVIPETIEGCNVVRLGNDLFRGCTKIEKVVVPEGVTGIGAYAFCGCSSMTAVNIPQGVKNIEVDSFSGCSSLATVSIPSGVKSIGDSAFYGCSGLISVSLPDTVTDIGAYAFENCCSLTSLIVPSSVTSIGEWAFYGCSDLTSVEISSEDTTIGDWAFGNCKGLVSVIVPGSCRLSDVFPHNYATIKSVALSGGAKSIAESAFSGCSGLESVLIPSSVTSIGDNAFAGCSGLRSVEIPGSVTSIGVSAFSDCSNLEAMTIPSGVTRINDSVFAGCSGLTSVVIPEGVTSVGEFAFRGCSALLSARIPLGVTSIGASAFSGCSSMLSVVIPPKMTDIKGGVFSGCSSLTMVTIPDGVRSIDYRAFSGCSGLRAVIMPRSVTSIDNSGYGYSFIGCDGLMRVYTDEGDVDRVRGLMGSDKCVVYSEKVMDDGIHSEQIFGANWCFEVSGECATIVGVDSADAFVCVPTCLGGAKVTSIGNSVFAERDELSSIAIPLTVTHISEQAFEGCRGLMTVYTGKGDVDRMRGLLVAGGLDLKDVSVCEWLPDGEGYTESVNGVEWTFDVIGGFAMVRKAEPVLSKLCIPGAFGGVPVTSIGNAAFRDCSGITLVSIPESVRHISDHVFEGCNGLRSVTMPWGLVRIGEYAFAECCELTSVMVPPNVVSIGKFAFFQCWNVERVYIEDLKAWCAIGFGNEHANPLYNGTEGRLFLNEKVIDELLIPDGVSIISSFAFAGYHWANRVVIPSSVRRIGDYAFAECWYAERDGMGWGSGIESLEISGSCELGADVFGDQIRGGSKLEHIQLLRINGEMKRRLRAFLGVDGSYTSYFNLNSAVG